MDRPEPRSSSPRKRRERCASLHKHDLTLSKTFSIRERLRFTFMAVAQNLANHPNFSNPASNINATNVGVVSSTQAFAPARQIMLRGRIQF